MNRERKSIEFGEVFTQQKINNCFTSLIDNNKSYIKNPIKRGVFKIEEVKAYLIDNDKYLDLYLILQTDKPEYFFIMTYMDSLPEGGKRLFYVDSFARLLTAVGLTKTGKYGNQEVAESFVSSDLLGKEFVADLIESPEIMDMDLTIDNPIRSRRLYELEENSD